MDEKLRDFISEAEEIISGINKNLLTLESAKDRTAVKPEVINALFRGAHTLKGMSGMVGLARLQQVSHVLEDLLDRLRLGKLAVSDTVLVVLFQGAETLHALIEMVSQGGGEDVDVDVILDKIRKVATGAPAETASPLKVLGLDPDILQVLTEYEEHRLKENIKAGNRLVSIKARFSLESFDKDLSTLSGKLQAVGEVITTIPSSGMTPETGIEFSFLMGTQETAERVKEHLSGHPVEMRELLPETDKEEEEKKEIFAEEVKGAEPEGLQSIKSLTPTVRVDISKLDKLLNIVGELVLAKAAFNQIGKDLAERMGFIGMAVEIQKVSQALDRKVADLQEGLIETRMVPIGQLYERLQTAVRRICREVKKEIRLETVGEETKLDKSMAEELADPLLHLIRNAVDHGIESQDKRRQAGKSGIGTIWLRAMERGNHIAIEVEDDGAGIDLGKVYQRALESGHAEKERVYNEKDLLNFLFLPGFSTAQAVTELSGRGVGLDVVAKNIARLNGLVEIETAPGKGTKFLITIPITLIILKALIVRVAGEVYAIPLSSVSECLMIEPHDIKTVEGREVITLRKTTLPLLRLQDVFQLAPEGGDQTRPYVIVVGMAEKRLGFVVHEIIGQQEIVIKSLGTILKDVRGVGGATELGNQKTILVLDVAALIDEATQGAGGRKR